MVADQDFFTAGRNIYYILGGLGKRTEGIGYGKYGKQDEPERYHHDPDGDGRQELYVCFVVYILGERSTKHIMHSHANVSGDIAGGEGKGAGGLPLPAGGQLAGDAVQVAA